MKIYTKQNNGLKALVLSDLHIFSKRDIPNIERIMDMLKKKQYDVVYIVGDIIDATNVLKEDSYITGRLLELFAFLGHIAPTYIVYGSHDLAYFSKELEHQTGNPWIPDEITFKEKFIDKVAGYPNINVLDNETTKIAQAEGYTISGVNPSLAYAMTTPDGNEELLLREKAKYGFLNDLDANKTNTLICHYPNAIETMHEIGLLENVDLSIAGHNHNGCTQFKILPVEKFFDLLGQKHRGLITPGKNLFPKDVRGVKNLDSRNTLVINPSIKTFAACTGSLENLDSLFYKGFTEIEYIPESEKRTRTK